MALLAKLDATADTTSDRSVVSFAIADERLPYLVVIFVAKLGSPANAIVISFRRFNVSDNCVPVTFNISESTYDFVMSALLLYVG